MKVSFSLAILSGISLGYLITNKMWIELILIFGILIPLLLIGIEVKYLIPIKIKGKK